MSIQQGFKVIRSIHKHEVSGMLLGLLWGIDLSLFTNVATAFEKSIPYYAAWCFLLIAVISGAYVSYQKERVESEIAACIKSKPTTPADAENVRNNKYEHYGMLAPALWITLCSILIGMLCFVWSRCVTITQANDEYHTLANEVRSVRCELGIVRVKLDKYENLVKHTRLYPSTFTNAVMNVEQQDDATTTNKYIDRCR